MGSSEAKLLKTILQSAHEHPSTVVANGDDAAVIEIGSELLALSVDSVVEGIHFSRKYFSPEQIGAKAIEVAASDIVAIGGKPEHLLISMHLTTELASSHSFCEKLYKGVYNACERLQCDLLGGDIVATNEFALAVTALGRISSRDRICPRSGAKPGDKIYISGPLGLSGAGLKALERDTADFDALKRAHREPRARINLVDELFVHANAMIDISDGLSSELWHLATASKCGIIIELSKIPLEAELIQFSELIGLDPFSFVFNGGEDYELLYSVSGSHAVPGIEIGYVVSEQGVWIENNGNRSELQNRGYDHLSS